MRGFMEKLISRLEENLGNANFEKATKEVNESFYEGMAFAYGDSINIVNQLAEEYNADIPTLDVNELFEAVEQNDISTDLMIVSSLPSLYPLQEFETEAVHRVVAKNATVGGSEVKRISNADRIRAMDNEELAEFLVNVETHGYHDQSVSGTLEMIEWLQSEAEE